MLGPRNDYNSQMEYLYHKSLILESPSQMDPVLYFYWMDAVAHLDYTLAALAQAQSKSPKMWVMVPPLQHLLLPGRAPEGSNLPLALVPHPSSPGVTLRSRF